MVAWSMLGIPEHGQTNVTVSPNSIAEKQDPMNLPQGWNVQAQEFISYDVTPAMYNIGVTLPSIFTVADGLGFETSARARPGAARIFQKYGYMILEIIQFEVEDLIKDGKTPTYIMKRNPARGENALMNGENNKHGLV
ncbi:hypothetical protein BOTCAL_0047g00020 [Botryotinia calthae]|uniref:Uncharacterized protein n=1 Tax=Botryotinia calthae TaxID=38488 RepID=A0A4Y8DB88_9HELO|nr:hypothetical protein BOTCAL_0047g00020 [Botryotinia calthae]